MDAFNSPDTSIESIRASLAISATKSIWEELDHPLRKFHKNSVLFEKLFTEWVKKGTWASAAQFALLVELYGMKLGASPTSWVEAMSKVGWYKHGPAHYDASVGFVKRETRTSKYDVRVRKGLTAKRGAELLTRFLLLCSDIAVRVAVTIKSYANKLTAVQVLKKVRGQHYLDLAKSGVKVKKDPSTDPLLKVVFWTCEELGSHDLKQACEEKKEELLLLGRRWNMFGKMLLTVHRVFLEKEMCSLLIPVWEFRSRAKHKIAVLDLNQQGLSPVRRRVFFKEVVDLDDPSSVIRFWEAGVKDLLKQFETVNNASLQCMSYVFDGI